MQFHSSACGISQDAQKKTFHLLAPFIEKLKSHQKEYAFLDVIKNNNAFMQSIAVAKKVGAPDCLVIVGIGGSNLGTLAIIDALFGTHHALQKQKPLILFSDTVDEDKVYDTLAIVEKILRQGKTVLVNGISKSGTTTETIANFELFVALIKKYKKKYEKQVIVTTDKESPYWHFALKNHFHLLEIPKELGGRYSVFSSVSLFPLLLAGANVKKLLAGAKEMQEKCFSSFEKNSAAQSAIIQYLQYKKEKKNISELFLFSTDLESMGKWYRQLLAESIGKERDMYDNHAMQGITPVISIGSTDLHSIGQLDLAGPKDKYTAFVFVQKNHHRVAEKKQKEYNALVPALQGISLSEIMHAIYSGTKKAFVKKNHPFTEIILPDKKEESLGQFLQYKMMEILYLGFLLKVNVFDQPEVELYKKETRKILAKKK